jgi:diadenosine tetraphosphate (Ap4A) HIT family hydrolase
VNQGHGLSRLPSQGITLEGECRFCAIAQSVAGHSTQRLDAYVVEDVDDDVIVISGPELDGLVVVPRQHISGLEELPVLRRAHVLAALRRATRSVLEANPGATTSVVVKTDPPASEGHACFHVLPSGSEAPVRSTSKPA